MRLNLGTIPLRLLSTATFLLFVQAVVAPSRVEASCGDYVMLGSRHGGQPMGQDEHSLSTHRDQSEAPLLPGRRCHGATCSNGDFPSMPPVPRVSSSFDHWACQFGNSELSSLFSDVLFAADSSPHGTYRGLSIFRPPRVG